MSPSTRFQVCKSTNFDKIAQRTELFASPSVSAYLAAMAAPGDNQEPGNDDEAADVDDFS